MSTQYHHAAMHAQPFPSPHHPSPAMAASSSSASAHHRHGLALHHSHGGGLGGKGASKHDAVGGGAGARGGHSASSSSGSAAAVAKVTSASAASSSASGHSGTSSSKSPSIASLCNLGNTCFLNSVLYTLRFTPGFLHSLHHMMTDVNAAKAPLSKKKKKAGSNGSLSNGHGPGLEPSPSSDPASADSEMALDIIEQLHDLFQTLSCADENLVTAGGSGASYSGGGNRGTGGSASAPDPIAPSAFLSAVGKLNPMFEGNQQQDAHELLVMILNILEDIKIPAASTNGRFPPPDEAPSTSPPFVPEKRGKTRRTKVAAGVSVGDVSPVGYAANGGTLRDSVKISRDEQEEQKWMPNFVKDNFEGKQVMRTRCLECELSTFRSETFTNIDVPLHLEEPEDVEELSGPDLFLKQILMSETLREGNKYWCEECGRLNEAQRSVEFELLPRVMVLQLKRFTGAAATAAGVGGGGQQKAYSVSKINDYIPTPFNMRCFCTQCMAQSARGVNRGATRQGRGSSKHAYKLYAVIMHLGATLASGHYIAYVRASAQDSAAFEYAQCRRVQNCSSLGLKETSDMGGHAHTTAPIRCTNGNAARSSSSTSERPAKTKKPGIMKFLRRGAEKSPSLSSSSSPALFTSTNGGDLPGVAADAADSSSLTSLSNPAFSSPASPCPGAACCGIRAPLQPSCPSASSDHRPTHHHRPVSNGVSNGVHGQRSIDSADSCESSAVEAAAAGEEVWLECDDESIQAISRAQFEGILSAKQGATTPYLLFYQRLE